MSEEQPLTFEQQKELINVHAKNSRELMKAFFGELNNTIKIIRDGLVEYGKLKRKMALPSFIIIGLIVVMLSWLTYVKIISGDALVFLMGTIAGYVYAYLTELI